MFESGAALTVGGLSVGVPMIGYLIGGLAVYLYLTYVAKHADEEWGKAFADRLFSAVVVYVLVYKLWPLVEQWPKLLENPLSLLLYVGGAYAVEGGIVLAGLWFIYGAYKGKWLHWAAVERLLAAYVLFQAGYALVVKKYGPPTSGWGWSQDGTTYLPANLLEAAASLLLFGLYEWHRRRRPQQSLERFVVVVAGICAGIVF
ncbi:MAG: hypothetical protein ACM32O_01460 [Clostridia bacterium]